MGTSGLTKLKSEPVSAAAFCPALSYSITVTVVDGPVAVQKNVYIWTYNVPLTAELGTFGVHMDCVQTISVDEGTDIHLDYLNDMKI